MKNRSKSDLESVQNIIGGIIQDIKSAADNTDLACIEAMSKDELKAVAFAQEKGTVPEINIAVYAMVLHELIYRAYGVQAQCLISNSTEH